MPANMRPKCFYFFVGQFAPLAGRQIAKQHRALTHANEPQHLVAKHFSNFTNLAFAALVQHDPHPNTIFAALQHVNPGWRRRHIVQLHAIAPLAQRLCRRRLVEQRTIFFFNLIAGVCQALGKLAVVGHQQQAFAVIIEPANRKQPRGQIDQSNHCWAALRIIGGGNDAGGFIQHDVGSRINFPDRLTVDENRILLGINACAGDNHDFAIDRHPAGANELLAVAPRGDTGARQYLL